VKYQYTRECIYFSIATDKAVRKRKARLYFLPIYAFCEATIISLEFSSLATGQKVAKYWVERTRALLSNFFNNRLAHVIYGIEELAVTVDSNRFSVLEAALLLNESGSAMNINGLRSKLR